MKIEILSIAMSDIQSGQHFYEQPQEGLGIYFLDSLFSDIDSAVRRYLSAIFTYFRALSKRFPYAIYYRVNGQAIQVWRVLDCRQKPSRIRSALRA
ncbi:MAG: type II toxin-antitoxin system RelE/ParE family toxin [Gallionellaceae bacterium]